MDRFQFRKWMRKAENGDNNFFYKGQILFLNAMQCKKKNKQNNNELYLQTIKETSSN